MAVFTGIIFILTILLLLAIYTIHTLYRSNKWLNYEISELRGKRDIFPAQSIRLVSSGGGETDNHFKLDENYLRNGN